VRDLPVRKPNSRQQHQKLLHWTVRYILMRSRQEKQEMHRFRFSIVIEKDDDGYTALCPELQGCYAQGETYEEVLEYP